MKYFWLSRGHIDKCMAWVASRCALYGAEMNVTWKPNWVTEEIKKFDDGHTGLGYIFYIWLLNLEIGSC